MSQAIQHMNNYLPVHFAVFDAAVRELILPDAIMFFTTRKCHRTHGPLEDREALTDLQKCVALNPNAALLDRF